MEFLLLINARLKSLEPKPRTDPQVNDKLECKWSNQINLSTIFALIYEIKVSTFRSLLTERSLLYSGCLKHSRICCQDIRRTENKKRNLISSRGRVLIDTQTRFPCRHTSRYREKITEAFSCFPANWKRKKMKRKEEIL